jgi:pimeloyl-ACP methyl ester carboxylesterase
MRVNAAPGATRAALAYQRHNLGPEGIAHNRARAERKLAMPVLAVGAESGAGATLPDTMRLVAVDVRGAVFAGCGHYMAEEAPRAVAEQLIRFMGE